MTTKYGRRECEICERRLTNVRMLRGNLVGDCPDHGTIAAWITGVRQNAHDAVIPDVARLALLEQEFEAAGGRGVELAEEIDALRAKLQGFADTCKHVDDDLTRCPNDANSPLENGYCDQHEGAVRS